MLRQFRTFRYNISQDGPMKKITVCIFLIALIAGCSSTKRSIRKSTTAALQTPFYDSQFTGLLVINSQNKDTLLDFNSAKYFTPASNTKIFTLFAALQLLPDSLPAFNYKVQEDTLFVEGTGDPTLLHPYFEQGETIDFMRKYSHIAIHLDNFKEEKLGSGWAWDDYQYYYQPEIGPLPLYGNVTTISNPGSLRVSPAYFTDSVTAMAYRKNRELERNRFYFSPWRKDTLEVPYRTDPQLTRNLLAEVLQKEVSLVPKMPPGTKRTQYGIARDTVLSRMMQVSDNFLAEQLLVLGSSTLSDTLSGAKVREHLLEHQLADLEQPPRWVDGSGLSRYNLFSPRSIVAVLDKMHTTTPQDQLFGFFPTGGVNGTLKEWYTGNPEPYIHAKSGSLGNVYCLSGYLLTKSGKTLIFSFMNNHFRHPSSEVKRRMQTLFETIRDTY